MLIRIDIENIAVFEKASINFENGLNVITGETGAGKTLIINSLNMVLGARASHGLIRAGKDYAAVSAVFFHKDTDELLSSLGIECDGGNIVISRKIYTDGRNLCRINGTAVSVSVLREVGKRLVVIHGQRDTGDILDNSSHLAFVDGFAHDEAVLKEYTDAFNEYKELSEKIENLKRSEEERRNEAEYLEYRLNEIKMLALSDGEEDELIEKKNILENAEELKNLSHGIQAALSSDGGAVGMLYEAMAKSEKLMGTDKNAESLFESVSNMYYEAEELLRDISAYSSGIESDYGELSRISERLDEINSAKHKYKMDVSQIISYANEAEIKLEELKSYDENKSLLQNKLNMLYEKAKAYSEKLSEIRKNAAKLLSEKINAELKFLDMANSEILFEFTKCALSPNGGETVEMLLFEGAASTPMPIGKIASGGEMSRIMLSVKSVFTNFDKTPTLLFDEIDTGVSGRAAEKIALKMRRLSSDCQIICVTHLPVIAAAGKNHILIEKSSANNSVSTKITTLNDEMRERAIAAMISGDNISEISIANARQMLKDNM